MKKLMTFITLSAIAISNYAQANEQPHQAHMNMQMSTGSAMATRINARYGSNESRHDGSCAI